MNKDMPSKTARLLGFAPILGLERLTAALNAIAGPPAVARRGRAVAALLQEEGDEPPAFQARAADSERRLTVRKRLQVGCQAGLFLPMDQSAACCPAESLPALLEPAQEALARALAAFGGSHQWDVVMRWSEKSVLGRHQAELADAAPGGPAVLADAAAGVLLRERGRREAALRRALDPVVRGFAPPRASASDCEIAVTVLIDADAEGPVEAALNRLLAGDGTGIDMHGPAPLLDFAAVRLATVDVGAVARAWALLELPEHVDLAALHRQWRLRAAITPLERQLGHAAVPLMELTAAYRLLRPLVGGGLGKTFSIASGVPPLVGHRLVVPDVPATTLEQAVSLAL